MSFGPHPFEAYATTNGLMGRWVMMLVSPIIVVIGAAALFAPAGNNPAAAAGIFVVMVFGIYALWAIIGLGFFAAYIRQVIGSLDLGGLSFAFTARSKDWLKLFMGHVGLVIVTLGVGLVFISYRNWSFFIRHLEASGTVDLDTMTQSEAAGGGDAEGLASAFDIGAI